MEGIEIDVKRHYAGELAKVLLAYSQRQALQFRNVHGSTATDWKDVGEEDFIISRSIEYRIKPEPKYRPFNSAEEFRPHRDRWVKSKNEDCDACGSVHHYSHTHVAFTVKEKVKEIEWRYAFEQLKFEDGSPFGVQCKE